MQTLADQVVNQTITVGQLYWFELELSGRGNGHSLSTRFGARMNHLMKSWGWKAAIPGATILAAILALAGMGRQDIVLESAKLPILLFQLPDQPPAGLGVFNHVLTARVQNTVDHVVYLVALT